MDLSFIPSIDSIIRYVANTHGALFLDSSLLEHDSARYSYLVSNPIQVIQGPMTEWNRFTQQTKDIGFGQGEAPFKGGWLGYRSYGVDEKTKTGPIPCFWFGLYESVLVLDHHENRCFLASFRSSDLPPIKEMWEHELQGEIPHGPLEVEGQGFVQPSLDNYGLKMKKIHEYLEAGDCYQVNLTERFELTTNQDGGVLYQRLRRASVSPFSAFMNMGDFQILSTSPECLFKIEKGIITTQPIKGTRKRGMTAIEDARLKEELFLSPKDRAELLMIVDLERNDLGRICQYSSVAVNRLYHLESFSQVHHLVADVSGRLREGIRLDDVFQALFPGGSVTGAPKKRAMEIIEEMEEEPRSVYTGALGFVGLDGYSVFNLPIRTLTKKGSHVYFHAGCGIVMDSEIESEYEEMMVKAKGMMEALGL